MDIDRNAVVYSAALCLLFSHSLVAYLLAPTTLLGWPKNALAFSSQLRNVQIYTKAILEHLKRGEAAHPLSAASAPQVSN
jgi:hypothetical protein